MTQEEIDKLSKTLADLKYPAANDEKFIERSLTAGLGCVAGALITLFFIPENFLINGQFVIVVTIYFAIFMAIIWHFKKLSNWTAFHFYRRKYKQEQEN